MIEHFPIKTTRGLELRPVHKRDAGELFQLTDLNRQNLRLWLPWLDGVRKRQDTEKFIQISQKHLEEKTGCVLSIRYQKVLIGLVDFHGLDSFSRHALIGYWLGEKWRGKGLMLEAVEGLIGFGFEKLDLHRLEIRIAAGNERSRRIPRKLGFQLEGRIREVEWLYDHFVDHEVYGLLREDWEKGSR